MLFGYKSWHHRQREEQIKPWPYPPQQDTLCLSLWVFTFYVKITLLLSHLGNHIGSWNNHFNTLIKVETLFV